MLFWCFGDLMFLLFFWCVFGVLCFFFWGRFPWMLCFFVCMGEERPFRRLKV